MNSLNELLASCSYTNLDSKQSNIVGKEQDALIRSLIKQFPDVEIESNWVELYFNYLEKLFDSVFEGKGFTMATKNIASYICLPYISVMESLRSLLDKYILHTLDKLEAVKEIRSKSKRFIEENMPNSLAAGWFVEIFLCNHSDAIPSKKWNFNEQEEEEVLSMISDVLSQIQNLVLTFDFNNYKDFKAISYPFLSFRRGFDNYFRGKYRKVPKSELKEIQHQINLIDLIGFCNLGLSIDDSFKKFYTNDEAKFSSEALKASSTENQLLSNGISLFTGQTKTGYILLLIRYFLISMRAVVVKIDNLKEFLKNGTNIGNVFGTMPLVTAIENLSLCTEEADEITTYLAKQLKTDERKIILKDIINDNHYKLIESYDAPKEGRFVKELVRKVCDLNSTEKVDVDLMQLLFRWNMIDENLIPEKDRFIFPKTFPETISGLEELLDQLKLRSHMIFNEGASVKDLESRNDLPDDIKKVYEWTNGFDDYLFVSLAKQKEIKMEIISQYESHMEEESEIEGCEFNWPKEVDIRKHINNDIIGIGRAYNGDYFYIDPQSISKKGKAIVFRNSHDTLLGAEAVANSLEEYIARMMINHCIRIYGPHDKLKDLLSHEVLLREE